ncbi:ATP-binding protein [Methylococcus sp. EFPC2]|uniref:sensor histidine kinase n=1 Tax=Methylococcus sp. EFPC2 TaxID=2812648 RepID=UPI00196727CA|nr:ATP-binding protein [Methylococcus sp. EFPC2]QSA96811.1 HAMP domain-containing protein [Methylococcus sp. EFPC2]
MDAGKLKPPFWLSIGVLFAAIVGSLHLMSSATQDSSQLNRLYSSLLLINTAGSALLLGLVVANAYSLLRQLKKRVAGSRLTARMAFVFLLLTLAPASIVFYYSMQFLQRSIDSWFDVRIDRALDDALELGRAALDERARTHLRQTEQTAGILENVPESMISITLGDLFDTSEDAELTVFTKKGRILASSGARTDSIVPDLPSEAVLLQVKRGKPYVGLEPAAGRLTVRAVALVPGLEENFYIQSLHLLPTRLAELAETVEAAFVHQKELNYLRSSLKTSFTLTLSLVLLLSLLAAIWVSFLSIRRIVAPVQRLAEGTRAVAEGHYEKRLPVKNRDELGFLVESFNAMTAKIARARDEAQHSRQEIERQRAYLETVLGNLSSGVMSFDAHLRLQTANHAAHAILGAEVSQRLNCTLPALTEAYPHLAGLLDSVGERLIREKTWQEEIHFTGPEGRQELLFRGTPLFDPDGRWQGAVVVFDDVTALIQAQRNAAWGEVARRLAHEIKNPLTPIQLSAERLRHKLVNSLNETEADILDKSTRTIVQQVEAMKSMVNAFAEYAKPAIMQIQRVDLDALIEEVVALYPPQSGLEFELSLAHNLPLIQADPVRLRQVLHNLIKNAQEAMTTAHPSGKMSMHTRHVHDNDHPHVEILVRDHGPGIAPEQAERVFDPYVTTKTKGTGLGLAIVKKIVEEHGGTIRLDPNWQEGAGFIVRLPAPETAHG